MSMEMPKLQLTPDQIIEGKFGREPVKEIEQISKTIFEQLKIGIANIGMQEGSSAQQQETVKQYLEMWRNFSNNLFVRTSSENAKSPEVVKVAIEGANSLLSVKPINDGSAERMKEALENR